MGKKVQEKPLSCYLHARSLILSTCYTIILLLAFAIPLSHITAEETAVAYAYVDIK